MKKDTLETVKLVLTAVALCVAWATITLLTSCAPDWRTLSPDGPDMGTEAWDDKLAEMETHQ